MPATPPPPITTNPDFNRAIEIRTKMRFIRRELEGQVDEAVDHARQLTDWRLYVAAYPWATFAAAALIGYWIVPRKSILSPDPQILKDTASEHAAALKEILQSQTKPKEQSWTKMILSAASGPLTKMAMNYVTSHFLPQFNQESASAQHGAHHANSMAGERPS